MTRKDKQVKWEDDYVKKLEELQAMNAERLAFLSTFVLPGFERDEPDSEDGEAEGGGGSGGSGGSGNVDIGTKFDDIINAAGKKYGINPYFIASIIKQESNFDPNAGSHAGARGLMQLMPATAAGLGVKNITDPKENVMGGTKYIKDMLQSQSWNPILALAAYNAGPGNVKKYGGVPPFKETQDYVKKIPANFKSYTGKSLTKDNVRWSGEMTSSGGSSSGATGDVKKVIQIGETWLKKSNRYVFGGGRKESDIKAGKFDCSSWVRYIFAEAGHNIMGQDGLWGNTTTILNNKKLKTITTKQLKPGDLIFFSTYKSYGHVGIYLGGTKYIGTQSSTGVAVVDWAKDSYWSSRLCPKHRRYF